MPSATRTCMPGAWMSGSRTSRSKSRTRDVAGLEETDEGRQPREALRVGVGPADEGEHLHLAAQVGAVVGQHVHEVVSARPTGGPPGTPGNSNRDCHTCPTPGSPRVSCGSSANACHRASSAGSMSAGAIGDCAGASCSRRRRSGRARRTRCAPGPSRRGRTRPGRTERHAHEVVLHAQCLCVLGHTVRDDDRDRPQHQLAEHHVVHDALAVGEVGGRARRRGRRAPAVECEVVDLVAGERGGDRLQELGLHLGEAGLGGDRGGDATSDEGDLLDVVLADVVVGPTVHALSLCRAVPVSRRPPPGPMLRRQAFAAVATERGGAAGEIGPPEPVREGAGGAVDSRPRRSAPPAWSWSRRGVPPQNTVATASGDAARAWCPTRSSRSTRRSRRSPGRPRSRRDRGTSTASARGTRRVVREERGHRAATVAPKSLRSMRSQTASSRRPPGRSTRAASANASTLAGKNIAPN